MSSPFGPEFVTMEHAASLLAGVLQLFPCGEADPHKRPTAAIVEAWCDVGFNGVVLGSSTHPGRGDRVTTFEDIQTFRAALGLTA